MPKCEAASIQINAVQLTWTDDSTRRALECRGTCGEVTTGRVTVRDVVKGKDRSEAWCFSCALHDALERGRVR